MPEPESAIPPGKRVILLTQWFDPEPAPKGLTFARGLIQSGLDVEVVTGFPNYPGGKLYAGYRLRPVTREIVGGVAVTRLFLFPSHDRSKTGRVLNYLSFFLSASLYLIFAARRADVVYAYHPPLTVGMAAIVAKFFRRTPVVLDVQDMWPDTLRATGMISNERLLRVIDWFCRFTWKRAARIAVLSPGFRRLLIERGVREDRITVIPNWAEEQAGTGVPADKASLLGNPDRFRVLFAGNMGPAQGLDTVLDAASLVASKNPRVEFCFLGSGIECERLKDRARAERIPNARFLPRVTPTEAVAYLDAADCLLVHLKADPLFAITIPSKTQNYMAAGKPIIMGVEGDAAELIRQSGGGVVVPSENPKALAAAVEELAGKDPSELAELGRKARRFYQEHLSFSKGLNAFSTLLRSAMK